MTGATASVEEEVGSLKELIAALTKEHRSFPTQLEEMREDLARSGDGSSLQREIEMRFFRLQDTLSGHMVTEEFEFYPVVADRGLLDETVSEIMQQHHEITAELERMGLSLRAKDVRGFRSALDALERTLRVHQPAEEEKVFPLVA